MEDEIMMDGSRLQTLFVTVPVLMGMALMACGTPLPGTKASKSFRWLGLGMLVLFALGFLFGVFGAFDAWVPDAHRLCYLFLLSAVCMSIWLQRAYRKESVFTGQKSGI
jgi:hypothetical protein